MASVVEPQIVGQVGVELGRLKAHLGGQLSTALVAERQLGGEAGVKADDRIRRQCAVLGCTEREHVDAELPGHLGRAHIEGHESVSETSTIHVDAQASLSRNVRQDAQLVDRVYAARLGDLSDAEHGGLNAVHVSDSRFHSRTQFVGVDLGVLTTEQHDL